MLLPCLVCKPWAVRVGRDARGVARRTIARCPSARTPLPHSGLPSVSSLAKVEQSHHVRSLRSFSTPPRLPCPASKHRSIRRRGARHWRRSPLWFSIRHCHSRPPTLGDIRERGRARASAILTRRSTADAAGCLIRELDVITPRGRRRGWSCRPRREGQRRGGRDEMAAFGYHGMRKTKRLAAEGHMGVRATELAN